MKKILTILILAFLMVALMQNARAADAAAQSSADEASAGQITSDDIQKSQSDALQTDKLEHALPEEAGKTLGNMKVTDSLDLSGGFQKIWSSISENIGEIFTGALRSAVVILLIAILCSIVASAFDGSSKYVVLAGILAISAVSVSNVSAFIGLGGKNA